MKKLVIFFIIILVIVAVIGYMYFNYKAKYREAQIKNAEYERYNGQEIYGTDLATLINKVANDNEKNHIQKDDKGIYIDNRENSIRVDIKFTDDGEVHSMEEIYNSGTDTFMQYYNQIKFLCTKVEYHNKTGRISYLYFEQVENK